MDIADWGLLMTAATAAGWVDAVVGGGGLILLPALFLVAPQLTPQAALATNKLTAFTGDECCGVHVLPSNPDGVAADGAGSRVGCGDGRVRGGGRFA